MTVSLLLEMAASADPDRLAVVDGDRRVSMSQLDAMATRVAGRIVESGARSTAYVGTGGVLLPLLIFASARAGVPFTPVNYRLSSETLGELISRLDEPFLVVDAEYADTVPGQARTSVLADDVLAASQASAPGQGAAAVAADPDDIAVVLFTSGTTSRPKAVQLSHANLSSYVMTTVEFSSAADDDAVLICVPPYHVAGVSAALSNIYAGRRMVYLRQFDPVRWTDLVVAEKVTNATVVPTMLDRIVAVLERDRVELPSLRTLAYGGSKVPLPLVRRTLDLLPGVGLVNAYGLTETSSTIAVLTPDDHWMARFSDNPAVARRLASVGRPVPGIEVEIRGDDGSPVPPGEPGELFIRGPQVSGQYAEIGSVLDENGWFPTRDVASLDADGYLYITGRADDTIIRGGENIAPAEVEDVLVEHPDVAAVAVIGVEDPEWGQALVGVVVPKADAEPDADELREYVRSRLRGSRTPDRIEFRAELPTTPTGKLLRRVLVDEFRAAPVD